MTKSLPPIDTVFAMPLRRGWGACQVILHNKKHAQVVVLDHWSLDRPTLERVTLRVLHLDHHFWPSAPYVLNAIDEMPLSYVPLGTAPSVMPDATPGGSYGMWASLPLQSELQLRWNALPEATRAAFHDKGRWPEPVTLPVPTGALRLTRGVHTLAIDFGSSTRPDALHVEDPARFDFAMLDALPALLKLEVTGEAPGLVDWLNTRPMIEALTWRGALPKRIDLSLTGLRSCSLDSVGDHALKLPADLDALTLRLAETASWRIEAELQGALLGVSLRSWRGEGVAGVAGVERARRLSFTGFDELDARLISDRYDPASLDLHGAPGCLRHSAALAKLASLESLEFWSCLDLDAANMPAFTAWPRLQRLSVVGALAEESAALKSHCGRDRRVSVRGPVTAEWARRNRGHLLGRWRDERKVGRARSAYASAFKKLEAAGLPRPKVQAAMTAFVKEINKIHGLYGGVSEREAGDVEHAWGLLARSVSPPLDAALTDAWLRDARKGW